MQDAEPDVITTDGFCVMPSRSLDVEVLIVAVSILIAGVFFIPPAPSP